MFRSVGKHLTRLTPSATPSHAHTAMPPWLSMKWHGFVRTVPPRADPGEPPPSDKEGKTKRRQSAETHDGRTTASTSE